VYEDDGHQIGYQALPKGVPVVSSEGIELGKVQRVLDNAREHIFDGIVIRTRDGDRFVDAPEVARITERLVTLSITEHEARSLPQYGGAVRKAHSRWRRLFGG
jgi:hypothetical protein